MLLLAPVSGNELSYQNNLEDNNVSLSYSERVSYLQEDYKNQNSIRINATAIDQGTGNLPFLPEKNNTYSRNSIPDTSSSLEDSLGALSGKEYPGDTSIAMRSLASQTAEDTLSALKGKITGEWAPMNDAFISYLEKVRSRDIEDDSDYYLGYIPGPVDLSHNTGKEIFFMDQQMSTGRESALPQKYAVSEIVSEKSRSVEVSGNGLDLRDAGRVSDVENQGRCGSCWAFSTYSSLESTLLPEESWDFSENNMKNTHGFDLAPCKGGNSLMSTAYLARWCGPVTESADPYKTTSSYSPSNLQEEKHVQDVWYVPSRSGPLDNENIKHVIMEKGAIYSTIYWNKEYFSDYYNSYYYGGSASGNHAITIVGWDDSYSRINFERVPRGNGAFLVKNSWGPEWGDEGYFYVSYYDSNIGIDNALFMAQDTANYENIYQYDPLGWIVSYGAGTDAGYYANIFTSKGREYLTAASFYTPVPDASYDLSIYLDPGTDPTSGTLAGEASGIISFPGYHTIQLDSPIELKPGQKFSVVAEVTTPGYPYPVPMEYPYQDYSSGATAKAGESFVSSDGHSWTDVTTIYRNTNVCIKAFTGNSDAALTPTPTPTSTPTVTPTVTPTGSADTIPPSITLQSPGSFSTINPGLDVTVQWEASDNDGISSVSIEYSIDNRKNWEPVWNSLDESGSIEWRVPEEANTGIAYMKATAFDTSGNSASKTILVFIRTLTEYTHSSFAGQNVPGYSSGGAVNLSSIAGETDIDAIKERIQDLYIARTSVSGRMNESRGYPSPANPYTAAASRYAGYLDEQKFVLDNANSKLFQKIKETPQYHSYADLDFWDGRNFRLDNVRSDLLERIHNTQQIP